MNWKQISALAISVGCFSSAYGGAPPAKAGQTKLADQGEVRAGPTQTPAETARCVELQTASRDQQPTPKIVLPPKPIALRSIAIDLPEDGCQKAASRFNFYFFGSDRRSKKGCFVNAFVNHGKSAADLATGLMWYGVNEYSFKEAQEFIKWMNEKKWDGYSDWRLPTTEEFLSVLQAVESDSSHLDRFYFTTSKPWFWTSDYHSKDRAQWKVNAFVGFCDLASSERPAMGLAVRTILDKEMEELRRAFEAQ